MVLHWVGQLVPPVPGEEEAPRPPGAVPGVSPGIVAQHGSVSEGVGEGQLYLQHLVRVEVQRQPDLGVPGVSAVHSVQHAAHQEHVGHQVVVEADVPGVDELHVVGRDLHDERVVVFLHGHDGP